LSAVKFEPRNILVIDFGQLGDVVLSLPALRAIRERFAQARITVVAGRPGAPVVELSGCADSVLAVDRVALRDGPKPMAIWRIAQLVKTVRQARFDFVIDLHSLYETNLLGYLSGAPVRLYARRPGRSLDFLSNFRPQPPIEDPSKHAVDRYLDVLKPLGIENVSRTPRLHTRVEDEKAIEELLTKAKAKRMVPLVGLFPGAGHPSRRWPLDRFAELATRLERSDEVQMVVLLGPEERALVKTIRESFTGSTIILDRLSIPQLAAALARLSVFVSNDTGPLHLATAVGTPVVMLLDRPTPNSFIPFGVKNRVIYSRAIEEIAPEEVHAAVRELLAAPRTADLFRR
jgi:ADP-heptose:LPS heptosyltransferase